MNNVQLIVGIAGEIKLTELGGDRMVAKCLAAIPNWRKKDGAKDFVHLVFWGANAKTAKRLLHKGSKIVISGRISSPFYERKGEDGSKKLQLSTEVVVEEFEFAGPPPQAQQQPYTAAPTGRGKAA